MPTKSLYAIFASLFVPAFTAGARSFYFFEILVLLLLFLIATVVGRLRVSWLDLLVIYLLFFLAVLVAIVQQYFYLSIHSFSLIRFLFVSLIVFLFRYISIDHKTFVSTVSIFTLVVVVIGVLQFVDGFLLRNHVGFNSLVARFYPYTGELSASDLAKTGGAHIKSGSFYRSTSIFDGHPIVYGDFLALISVFFLHWRKYFIYLIIFVGVLLTFSRGSWLMYFSGLCFHYFLTSNKFNVRAFVWILFSVLCLATVVAMVPAIHEAFSFRIVNTLFTLGLSDVEVGRTGDPRTAEVWPEFLRVMNENAPYSYIAGFNAGIPTDSGYLAVLRESGILGFVFFGVFSGYILKRSNFDKVILTLFFVLAVGMVVHPVHQGYKGLFLICLCIAFHINFLKRSFDDNVMSPNIRSSTIRHSHLS